MLPLLLQLSRGKQIQSGANWETVVGYSVALLFAAAVGVLVALAISRSLHARRRRGGRSRRKSSGRRPA